MAPEFVQTERGNPQPGTPGDSAFRACLLGEPDFRHVIDYSVNLTDWIPVQTNVLGGSCLQIDDRHEVGESKRFYRARVVPF